MQRDDALARGIQLIEWTFDPMELKNAFFNIERLGAIVRRYAENQYGITASPLHGGLPTDRCYAEWWIDSPRVRAVLAGQPDPPRYFAEMKRINRDGPRVLGGQSVPPRVTPRALEEGHIVENLDNFDFTLSDGEMRRLSALRKQQIRIADPPERAPKWDVEAVL